MATNFENSNFPCATGKEMTEVQESVLDLAEAAKRRHQKAEEEVVEALAEWRKVAENNRKWARLVQKRK